MFVAEREVILDATRRLWLTEISRQTYDDQAIDGVGGDDGLFIVLEDEGKSTFEILAKAVSAEAGTQLLDLLAATVAPRLRLITGAGT